MHGASRIAHDAGAFTLIELLLAVAIFSIVLVAINTVFVAALRLRQRVSETVDEALPLNRALDTLQRDLQNAVPPGQVLAGNFSSEGPVMNASSQSSPVPNKSVANLSPATTGGLDFFTSTGKLSDDQPWGDLQEVNYQLMDPLDRTHSFGKDLVRSVTRNLLAASSPDTELQRLLGNVERLDFSYFDGLQWQDSWNTATGNNGLPVAVRMTLQMAANPAVGDTPQPIQMVVLVESESVTNLTQNAGGAQ